MADKDLPNMPSKTDLGSVFRRTVADGIPKERVISKHSPPADLDVGQNAPKPIDGSDLEWFLHALELAKKVDVLEERIKGMDKRLASKSWVLTAVIMCIAALEALLLQIG